MNEAQKNLIELLGRIPKENTIEREFIEKCIEVWNDYTDMEYSTPHWQLKRLEENYKLKVHELNKKY